MQAMIANLLLGLEQKAESPGEMKVNQEGKTPFLELLRELQKDGPKAGKIQDKNPLTGNQKPLFLFLDEAITGRDLEEVKMPAETKALKKEKIQGDEELMGLIRELIHVGDFEKARETIGAFILREKGSQPGNKGVLLKEGPQKQGKIPILTFLERGKKKEEVEFPGKKAEKKSSELKKGNDLLQKGEKNLYPKKTAPEGEREIQGSFLGKKSMVRVTPVRAGIKEKVKGQDPKEVKTPLSSVFKGVKEKPKLLPSTMKPDIFFEEEKAAQSGKINQTVLPVGGLKEEEENKSPFALKKRMELKRTQEGPGKSPEFLSGFPKETQGRRGSLNQAKNQLESPLDPFQTSQRLEVRQPKPEPLRQIENPIRSPDFFQQIVDRARLSLINREEGTMEIKLRPEYLGGLRMRVVFEDGQLRAHFQVENHLTREILENNLTTLRDNLSREGLNFDDVEVNVQGEGSQNPEHGGRDFYEGKSDPGESQEPLEESLYSILEKNRVDYRV